jgi:hypothetical protein
MLGLHEIEELVGAGGTGEVCHRVRVGSPGTGADCRGLGK